jgi:membrane protease YdiL (CAAX protease family)
MFLGELLIGPITEEVVGRGVILAILLRYTESGPWMALFISAFVFAGSHMVRDIYDALIIFGGGLVLGYGRMATNSVALCIVCHSLWNGIPYLFHE